MLILIHQVADWELRGLHFDSFSTLFIPLEFVCILFFHSIQIIDFHFVSYYDDSVMRVILLL